MERLNKNFLPIVAIFGRGINHLDRFIGVEMSEIFSGRHLNFARLLIDFLEEFFTLQN